ncbi:MAG: hypothetical protein V9G18_09925 [Albidovulum sp.]
MILVLAQPANALVCVPLDGALAQLGQGFGETPVFQGVLANGAVVITAAADGGTFTVLLVTPAGAACEIASGDGWSSAPPTHPGKDG